MLVLSPKATVPVLQLNEAGESYVLEESIEIMLWALKQNDPSHWLGDEQSLVADSLEWIAACDGEFKYWLDRYKYADRYPDFTQEYYREKAMRFISQIEEVLEKQTCLLGEKPSLADVAVFPFVRQFAYVDKSWFNSAVGQNTREWLDYHLASVWFKSVMDKVPQWHPEDNPRSF